MVRWLFLSILVCSIGVTHLWADYRDQLFQTKALLVSNIPEKVSEPSVLIDNYRTSSPVRVLYYHVNGALYPLQIRLSIRNLSGRKTTVIVQKGVGGPSEDGVFCGHVATKMFFKNILDPKGTPIDIEAGGQVVLAAQDFDMLKTVTGIFQIIPDKLSPIAINLEVLDPLYPQISSINMPTNNNIYQIMEIAEPIFKNQVLYQNTGLIGEFTLGDSPYTLDSSSKKPLKGNYGVIHYLDVTLKNVATETRQFEVWASPRAGVSRAVFVIDDAVVESGLYDGVHIRPQRLFSVPVPGKSAKKIYIVTMPQPGSNYPLNVVFRATDIDSKPATEEAKL